jgi:UrcA family protein
MSTFTTTRAAGLRFRFALLMFTGGLGCGMAVGTAGAATAANDVPSLVVHYSAETLATDDGVQLLYRRIIGAAKQVCPDESVRDLGASARVKQCRAQAVARAIQLIGNSRLAALHATSSKSG